MLRHPEFLSGRATTSFIERRAAQRAAQTLDALCSHDIPSNLSNKAAVLRNYLHCQGSGCVFAVEALLTRPAAACRHPQLFTFNVSGTTAQSSKMLTYLADLVTL